MEDDSFPCFNCSHFTPRGEMMIFDITCEECNDRFCGKCHEPPHYPALCTENMMYSLRDDTTIPQPLILLNRLARLALCWEGLDEILVALRNIENAYDAFEEDSSTLFEQRLQGPFTLIREAVTFTKWLHLHCCYKPAIASIFGERLAILHRRFRALVSWIPQPGFPIAQWPSNQIRVRLSHLLAWFLDVTEDLPDVRRALNHAPGTFLDFTREEAEEDRSSAEISNAFWTLKLSLVLEMM